MRPSDRGSDPGRIDATVVLDVVRERGDEVRALFRVCRRKLTDEVGAQDGAFGESVLVVWRGGDDADVEVVVRCAGIVSGNYRLVGFLGLALDGCGLFGNARLEEGAARRRPNDRGLLRWRDDDVVLSVSGCDVPVVCA